MPITQNAVNSHEYHGIPITVLAESASCEHERCKSHRSCFRIRSASPDR
jgi:hypothetical protein